MGCYEGTSERLRIFYLSLWCVSLQPFAADRPRRLSTQRQDPPTAPVCQGSGQGRLQGQGRPGRMLSPAPTLPVKWQDLLSLYSFRDGNYVTFVASSVSLISSFHTKFTHSWLFRPTLLTSLFRLSSHLSFGHPLLYQPHSFACHALFGCLSFPILCPAVRAPPLLYVPCPCCTCPTPAVRAPPLLYVPAPLLYVPRPCCTCPAPAVRAPPLLYAPRPCCTRPAPAVRAPPLLYVPRPCCTCPAPLIRFQTPSFIRSFFVPISSHFLRPPSVPSFYPTFLWPTCCLFPVTSPKIARYKKHKLKINKCWYWHRMYECVCETIQRITCESSQTVCLKSNTNSLGYQIWTLTDNRCQIRKQN